MFAPALSAWDWPTTSRQRPEATPTIGEPVAALAGFGTAATAREVRATKAAANNGRHRFITIGAPPYPRSAPPRTTTRDVVDLANAAGFGGYRPSLIGEVPMVRYEPGRRNSGTPVD